VHFTHKNIALIFIAVIIIGGAFALAEFRNTQKQKVVYSAPIQAVVNELPSDLQTVDSDNDGLKDWEEVLLGTNSRIGDSDGDGTLDGKEAEQGRNPLVKGPSDKASDMAKTAAAVASLSETDKLARDFFARYMELNQAGLVNDTTGQADLIDQVLKSGVVLNKPKSYGADNIFLGMDTSAEAVRQYGNQLGQIFKKYYNAALPNEVNVVKEALEKEDFELLKQIDPIIANYKGILTDVLKVQVPPSLVQNHLLLINSMSTVLFSAEEMRKVEKDTLSGINGSSVWLGAVQGLNTAFNNLKAVFKANGLTFTASEGGAFFIPE
jgi:hypothetical protein